MEIVQELPASLAVPILVVVHTRTEGESYLADILNRRSEVPVVFGTDGAAITAGQVYVAPTNQHMLVVGDAVRLHQGPRENGFRPAVDPLFRTAARRYGARTLGIILSGALDDGTYGLKLVKDAGGIAVVQDPKEAAFPGMPLSAMRYVDVDHVLSAVQIAELIASLNAGPREGATTMARQKEPEPQNPAEETDVEEMEATFGPPSGMTCPDCGGALWELKNGELMRYRCHVGHQYTTDGLDAGQQHAVESALWSAVRVLEEHADLRKRMATRTQAAGMAAVASGFTDSALDSKRQADTIRQLLFSRSSSATQAEPEPASTVKHMPPRPQRGGVPGKKKSRSRAR